MEGESGALDSVVIGVGVNANNADFPPELRDVAGSVYLETGARVDRARLAAELVLALDAMYDAWRRDPRAYLEAYRALCVTTGREVRVLRGGRGRRAYAEAVTDDFGLLVRYDDGTRETVAGGEVSVRGLFGYQ